MITEKDKNFYNDAWRLAQFGEHRVRVGCVGVYNGKRIAGGFNTFRNIARNVHFTHATYHAEMNVIRMIPTERLPKTILYVARINLDGIAMRSEPCDRCMETLKSLGIKAVIFRDTLKELVKVRL